MALVLGCHRSRVGAVLIGLVCKSSDMLIAHDVMVNLVSGQ